MTLVAQTKWWCGRWAERETWRGSRLHNCVMPAFVISLWFDWHKLYESADVPLIHPLLMVCFSWGPRTCKPKGAADTQTAIGVTDKKRTTPNKNIGFSKFILLCSLHIFSYRHSISFVSAWSISRALIYQRKKEGKESDMECTLAEWSVWTQRCISSGLFKQSNEHPQRT